MSRLRAFTLLFAAFAGAAHAQPAQQGRSAMAANAGAPIGMAQRFGGFCQGCDLSQRALTGVRIQDGDFTGARFVRSQMARMQGAGSTFIDADFSLANLSFANLTDTRCTRARFAGAIAASITAERAQLAGADFSNAEAQQGNFTQADLRNANFNGARVDGADFLGADLRAATFVYANLRGADFAQADLRNADFGNAVLTGADLSSARNLTRAQLARACGDETTRLPVGLRVPRCS